MLFSCISFDKIFIFNKMKFKYKPVFKTWKNMSTKSLTLKNLNPSIIEMQYAPRGPLLIRASELEKELEDGKKKPFKEILKANLGDSHALNQKPFTFLRQVLALVTFPDLLKDPKFPDDAKCRANDILKACKGNSVGAYTDSPGLELIRRQVAKYIEARDNHPSDWKDIVLCSGVSDGVKSILKLFKYKENGKRSGVMIPIPQYPLYSATLSEFNIAQIGYYLNEDNNWELDINELERAYEEAKKDCVPRAIVVINPGNPTGQVLTEDNIKQIICFAYNHKLFVFADEVYQENIWDSNSKFYPFKKVLMDMGDPYNKLELSSFISCSKGYYGECGLRGGCSETINMDKEVKLMFHKSISVSLCPTVLGQSALYCLSYPPQPHEPSNHQFCQEKSAILDSLRERALMVQESLNNIDGVCCNPLQGAMYAFPKITIPPKAIEKAKEKKQTPCTMYAFELLEETGICIVPGSGFGQKPGTYHIRTTILPQKEKLKIMLSSLKEFHSKFVKKYS